jgi:hypothetical protein
LAVQARLVDPLLAVQEVTLKQTGAGRYESQVHLEQPGTYLVQISAQQDVLPLGQVTAGLVVPYSPEYRASGLNLGLLEALGRAAGGGMISDPGLAFLHDLPAVAGASQVWRTLLLIAALLFPLDVALRRLVLTRRDWQQAVAWVRQRLPRRKVGERRRGPVLLGSLFQARQRARQRQARGEPHAERPASQPAPTDLPPAIEQTPKAPQPEKGTKDTLSRLREVKKRKQF